jgi:hypothetical protein
MNHMSIELDKLERLDSVRLTNIGDNPKQFYIEVKDHAGFFRELERLKNCDETIRKLQAKVDSLQRTAIKTKRKLEKAMNKLKEFNL